MDCPNCAKLKAERDSLAERLREAEADAIRYRWIRDNAYSDTSSDRYEGYRHWFAVYDDKREGLDAVIDRAALAAPSSAPAPEKGGGA